MTSEEHWPPGATAPVSAAVQSARRFPSRTLKAEQPPASAAQASPAYTWHVAPTGLRLEAAHRNASFPANNRVAFNIAASKYRLPGGGVVLGTDRVRATRGHNT